MTSKKGIAYATHRQLVALANVFHDPAHDDGAWMEAVKVAARARGWSWKSPTSIERAILASKAMMALDRKAGSSAAQEAPDDIGVPEEGNGGPAAARPTEAPAGFSLSLSADEQTAIETLRVMAGLLTDEAVVKLALESLADHYDLDLPKGCFHYLGPRARRPLGP